MPQKLLTLQMFSDENYRPANRDKYHDLRRDIISEMTKIISEFDWAHRFFTESVPAMFLKAVNANQDLKTIREAFEYLEMYCLNLINYYWKPEVSFVKRYTGIYRTKLLDVLPDVDEFMKQLGYEKAPTMDELTMKTYVSRTAIRQLAFDCLLVQTHCTFLDKVIQRAQHLNTTIGWQHVARCMEQIEGDEEACAKLVHEISADVLEYSPPIRTVSPQPQHQSLSHFTNVNMKPLEDSDLYA